MSNRDKWKLLVIAVVVCAAIAAIATASGAFAKSAHMRDAGWYLAGSVEGDRSKRLEFCRDHLGFIHQWYADMVVAMIDAFYTAGPPAAASVCMERVEGRSI